MKARDTKIETLFSSHKTQFVIPVYQRNYDWTREHCKQLLNDILEVGGNQKKKAHFIGSIVLILQYPVYTSPEVHKKIVIDGQQRLTTLTIIYWVLHQLAEELGDDTLAEKIYETYLINKFTPEEKLKLTENNHKALNHLLRGDDRKKFADSPWIIKNFNYFKKKVTEENYKTVENGLAKLMLVEVMLQEEEGDDPQRIFESLNSTGLVLSEADLIRNYILMELKREDQEEIYRDYWEVIENSAKDEKKNENRVSDYIRDYLTLKNKNIPKKSEVYITFKEKYPISSDIDELKNNLAELKKLVAHYNKLINPKKESDKDIRLQLEYINRLGINVAFPFLMQVYDDYYSNTIDKTTFRNVLTLMQSFIWRRFITDLPTNSLNKIFKDLYDKVDSENYLYSIQQSLLHMIGPQRFPKDEEVVQALKIKDVYTIKPKNRAYLLEMLENFENKERVIIEGNSDITIEHIFPQNPDPQWKDDLGDDEYNDIKENYLHTIGNLTLSGNNSSLGNKPFKDKRDLKDTGYKASRLLLNKYLAGLDKWGKDEIEKRTDWMSERFLKIWEYPKIKIEANNINSELNIFNVDDPTGKKLEYAIFLDEKIEVSNVTDLYVEVFKRLFELQPETFFTPDLQKKIGFENKDSVKILKSSHQISDIYSIKTKFSNVQKFDKIKYALEIFDLEDELSIKYADN